MMRHENGGSLRLMLTTRGKTLVNYWQQLRGDALIPRSEDLKLEQLGKEVAACLYCEWDDAGRIPILYAGVATVEELGIDVSGHDMLAFSSAENKAVSRLLFAAMRDQPCGVLAKVTFQAAAGVPMLFEALYLPVQHQGAATRLLMSIASLSAAFRSGDVEGAGQASGFDEVFFVDLGAGTPETSGLLGSIKSCALADLTADQA